jgi:hypothetical protein
MSSKLYLTVLFGLSRFFEGKFQTFGRLLSRYLVDHNHEFSDRNKPVHDSVRKQAYNQLILCRRISNPLSNPDNNCRPDDNFDPRRLEMGSLRHIRYLISGPLLNLMLVLSFTTLDAAILCGDSNGDDQIDVGDAVFDINYIFRGGPPPVPLYSGDANCDDETNVGDAVSLISHIFSGGDEPCCSTFYGLNPPGMAPEQFLPDILTSVYYAHGSLTFSVDAGEVYWSAYVPGESFLSLLQESNFDGLALSLPIVPAYSMGPHDGGPAFSHDGNTIFYSARRLIPGVCDDSCYAVWKVDRTAKGWGDPEPILATADTSKLMGQVTVSANGNLYFTGRWNSEPYPTIFQSTFEDGNYSTPEEIQGPINSLPILLDPYVNPDEQFMLLTATPSMSVATSAYISYRQEDDLWGTPIRIENGVSTNRTERFASLSRDGKYLFFLRALGSQFVGPDTFFYWISAEVLPPAER